MANGCAESVGISQSRYEDVNQIFCYQITQTDVYCTAFTPAYYYRYVRMLLGCNETIGQTMIGNHFTKEGAKEAKQCDERHESLAMLEQRMCPNT